MDGIGLIGGLMIDNGMCGWQLELVDRFVG